MFAEVSDGLAWLVVVKILAVVVGVVAVAFVELVEGAAVLGIFVNHNR